MNDATWYVVKQADGQCAIVPASQMENQQGSDPTSTLQRWGPYDSQQSAIAHRIGLIRAGKCQPA
ncbi:hypothetical protein H6F86_21905 [Phormidium sp. FACHB-592]|uniref:DDE transposase family protein n=1 Tax=Stenomitos frigidus AS-A4 TaxID=2933935 RepID=A0ABV0KFA4_9CYAN|nr:hypothetical protein [Phormidium sp. FACHB-592]MBD2076490.1 hypothetical protein [Phormidium sp. FACHB-592]